MELQKEKLTNWLSKKSPKELFEIAAACGLSVKKWDNIIAGTGEDRRGENCALCILRNNSPEWKHQGCESCIVGRVTGGILRDCKGIGWDKWQETAQIKRDPRYPDRKYLVIGENNPEAEKCAVEIRDNLIKIRDFVKNTTEKIERNLLNELEK